ncbi:MAG: DUF4350 domain-containing protein [Anaerolineae bacterium]|nr:DUF4350 domain-containing protein [Gemmatimonadaceae bacterium]
MSAGDSTERWLTPRVVFTALGVLTLIAILALPEEDFGEGIRSLTTRSYDGSGARGVFEVASRLGWRVERRETPLAAPLDSNTVYVVLAPPEPLTTGEVNALLDAVRRGAGLFVIPENRTPLADSLRLRRTDAPRMMVVRSRQVVRDSAAFGSNKFAAWANYTLNLQKPIAADTTSFLTGLYFTRVPIAVGFSLGRGRVVGLADPGLIRNRSLRRPLMGVEIMRMFGWVTPSIGAPMVFTEYHQGFGQHANVSGLIAEALLDSAPGRTTLQLIAAALILLAALAPRPITPVAPERIERRSPLEHVGALARAYEQVGATRLAAQRMVRGLRRRHPFGGVPSTDASYLGAIKLRHPETSNYVDTLETAMQRALPPADFVSVGLAIDNIERTLNG